MMVTLDLGKETRAYTHITVIYHKLFPPIQHTKTVFNTVYKQGLDSAENCNCVLVSGSH